MGGARCLAWPTDAEAQPVEVIARAPRDGTRSSVAAYPTGKIYEWMPFTLKHFELERIVMDLRLRVSGGIAYNFRALFNTMTTRL